MQYTHKQSGCSWWSFSRRASHQLTNEAPDIIRRNDSAVPTSAKLSAPQDSSLARSRSQVGRSHLRRQVVDAALSSEGGLDHDLVAKDSRERAGHDNIDDVDNNNSDIDNSQDPEIGEERQQFPPPQYPISEASGETATSLVSYRTAPPPFSSLFASFSSATGQPHDAADQHGQPGSEPGQDHELYDTELTGGPRERSLPAPAYEPPAGSSSAPTTAYQESLANETKRALPQDTKGSSKDDDAEPPPAYEEGYSPLESFSYVMAAAGGASSIITQVQQGGPPINTIGGEHEPCFLELDGLEENGSADTMAI